MTAEEEHISRVFTDRDGHYGRRYVPLVAGPHHIRREDKRLEVIRLTTSLLADVMTDNWYYCVANALAVLYPIEFIEDEDLFEEPVILPVGGYTYTAGDGLGQRFTPDYISYRDLPPNALESIVGEVSSDPDDDESDVRESVVIWDASRALNGKTIDTFQEYLVSRGYDFYLGYSEYTGAWAFLIIHPNATTEDTGVHIMNVFNAYIAIRYEHGNKEWMVMTFGSPVEAEP